jgi:ABC-2 type transport system permease protein
MIRILTIAQIVWLKMIRKKDLYVLLILLAGLLLTLTTLNIFGIAGVVRYITETGLNFAWLFSWILAVIVTARELPNEEKQGTIFPLLAKPINRMELIIGKWLGSWSIVCVATLSFYILVASVVILKGGTLNPIVLIQGIILHCCAISIICAISLFFSIKMNSDAAATMSFTFTATSFLLVPWIPRLMKYTSGIHATAMMVVYNLLPHFEIFNMKRRIVHDFDPIQWSTFIKILMYSVVITSFFIVSAWIGYRKKRFVRGSSL